MSIKKITEVFRPSAPIDNPDSLFGRLKEKSLLERGFLAPGRHIVAYGDRGVGKTSILRVVTSQFCKKEKICPIYYICSYKDKFEDIFASFLRDTNQLYQGSSFKEKTSRDIHADLKIPIAKGGAKAVSEREVMKTAIVDTNFSPHTLVSNFCNEPYLFIIDEFDRIQLEDTKKSLAETIKILADIKSPTKIVVCGVSNSSQFLIGAHPSTIRNILTLPIQPMPSTDIEQIIIHGFKKLKVRIESKLQNFIVKLSCGLPYFTHLICEELAIHALENDIKTLSIPDFFIILDLLLANVSENTHHEFNYAIESKRKLNFLIDDFGFKSGEPTSRDVYFPSVVRKYAVFSLVLSSDGYSSFESTKHYRQLAALKIETLPIDYKDIDEETLYAILDDLTGLSDIIVNKNGAIKFFDPYFKAYTWLRVAKYVGKEILFQLIDDI